MVNYVFAGTIKPTKSNKQVLYIILNILSIRSYMMLIYMLYITELDISQRNVGEYL